ncbi:type VII secretion-associated protein [Mycobacterium botniense]|uniref:Type VII secretion-associated protein n=1 Tax=Mycobacterium botniense TaxID=84962 RepID=A0A7I9XSS6_9MYCO|nr:type VII secretion-associated protein [Mycobacterium botniense]
MVADAELADTALDAIDDAVGLVDGHPVAVEAVWSAVLGSLDCGRADAVLLVHPSWWATWRVDMVSAAAGAIAGDVVARPRSWLLAQAVADPQPVVVEVAERVVVVTGCAVAAVPRSGEPHTVADTVAQAVTRTSRGGPVVVVIDAPGTITAAAGLAALIAEALRGTEAGCSVVEVGDAGLQRLVKKHIAARPAPAQPADSPRHTLRRRGVWATMSLAGVASAAAVLAIPGHRELPAQTEPTTFLVEGRVALTVPAHWAVQRIVGGPGSPRVRVSAPGDPEVALHVTQSPVAGETLARTAETLKQAIDAQPAGVFVDFNPAGQTAGRPAVTYREVRTGHDIRWTVLLDGAVRISVGCQSPPGGEQLVREACEQAVRSARALNRSAS